MKGKGRDKQYTQNRGNSQALQVVNPKEDDACFSTFKILQQQRENKGSVCARVFLCTPRRAPRLLQQRQPINKR